MTKSRYLFAVSPSVVFPMYAKTSDGVKRIDSKLPKAELNTADASSPPESFVNTITEDIVIGRQEHTTIPPISPSLITFSLLILNSGRVAAYTIPESTPKLKTCTNKLNLPRFNASENFSVFNPSPDQSGSGLLYTPPKSGFPAVRVRICTSVRKSGIPGLPDRTVGVRPDPAPASRVNGKCIISGNAIVPEIRVGLLNSIFSSFRRCTMMPAILFLIHTVII